MDGKSTIDLGEMIDAVDRAIETIKKQNGIVAAAADEIRRMRDDYVRDHVREVQRGWKSSWGIEDAHKTRMDALRVWTDAHPALAALWRHHEAQEEGDRV